MYIFTEENNCPICDNNLPENFTEVYCNSAFGKSFQLTQMFKFLNICFIFVLIKC